MQSFKYNYVVSNFIICLKSIKLYSPKIFHLDKFHQKNIFKYSPILISINTILNITKISKNEKYRINNIIQSFSLYAQIKHTIVAYKYIQQFKYQYKKHSKYKFEPFINLDKKQTNTINTIAFTYIYILYKILNSKNPLFIYYYLTKHNKKL